MEILWQTGGSGGGSGTGFAGIVTVYSDLPVDDTADVGEVWLVRQSEGAWFFNRKQRGLYQRIDDTGVRDADWQYLGEWQEEFNDANFQVYNNSDSTKVVKLDVSTVATATTRTLIVPNADGTIALLSDVADALSDAADYTDAAIAGLSTVYQPLDAGLSALAGGSDFVQFAGPTTSTKVFTLPDAAATILTSNAAVTVAQGGTGLTSYAEGDLLYGTAGGALAKLAAPAVPGYVLGSTAGVPTWEQLSTLTATTITGTANQVLVNGTSGSGQTGSVTLTLDTGLAQIGALADPNADQMLFWDDSAGSYAFLTSGSSVAITGTTLDTVQDIRTSAVPQFAGLVVPSGNLIFRDPALGSIAYIKSETSNGGLSGVASQWFIGTATPSSDCSALLIGRALSGSRTGGAHGVRDESSYAGSGAGLLGYASFDSIPSVTGAATYNHIASFQSRIQYSGSGSIPNVQGLTYQTTHSGSGTIAQSFAVFVDDDLGTGPITTQAGLYIGQLSRATNNFSIYSSGTQQSYHEGLWQVNNAVQTQTAFRAFTTGQTDPGQIVTGTQHRTIGAAATSVIEQWDSFAAASAFIARRSNGTSASPTRLSSGDAIYSILARGRYDGGFSGTSAQITFEASEDWTASNIIGSRVRMLTALNGGGGVAERFVISGLGNIELGTKAAIATTATDGFVYITSCAGTPTGTPSALTGLVPIVVDTTNNKLYFYSGGAWRDAGP